jgi:hypothetical protein
VGATARRLPALADAIRDVEALSIEVCIKKRARGGGPLALAAAADRRFTIVFDVAPHLPPQNLTANVTDLPGCKYANFA